MRADELRKLLRASPFRPFTIYLASEKSFKIPHPEFALVTPAGHTLVISPEKGDGVDILDVPLISRIEIHESTASEN